MQEDAKHHSATPWRVRRSVDAERSGMNLQEDTQSHSRSQAALERSEWCPLGSEGGTSFRK